MAKRASKKSAGKKQKSKPEPVEPEPKPEPAHTAETSQGKLVALNRKIEDLLVAIPDKAVRQWVEQHSLWHETISDARRPFQEADQQASRRLLLKAAEQEATKAARIERRVTRQRGRPAALPEETALRDFETECETIADDGLAAEESLPEVCATLAEVYGEAMRAEKLGEANRKHVQNLMELSARITKTQADAATTARQYAEIWRRVARWSTPGVWSIFDPNLLGYDELSRAEGLRVSQHITHQFARESQRIEDGFRRASGLPTRSDLDAAELEVLQPHARAVAEYGTTAEGREAFLELEKARGAVVDSARADGIGSEKHGAAVSRVSSLAKEIHLAADLFAGLDSNDQRRFWNENLGSI